MTTYADIKPLEGWITIKEAQARLGISKQQMHKLIDQDEVDADDLRSVADGFMYLVRTEAVERLKIKRAAAKARREAGWAESKARREDRVLRHEVRQWLRDQGEIIPNSHEITDEEIAAYRRAMGVRARRKTVKA